MAEADDNSERTEDPTPQRREDFRKRGMVAQSREFSAVFVLFAVIIMMWLLGRFFLEQLYEVFTKSFTDYLVATARHEDWIAATQFAFGKAALVALPLALLMWLVNVTSVVIQVGFLNNEEALKLDFNKIDPVAGFKKIFSLKAVIEGLKAVLKVSLVGAIVYALIMQEIHVVPKLVGYDMNTLLYYVAELVFKLFLWVALFMLVLAGFDYFYQRWELEKQMRMTKQEVKEEVKSREGDPLIRARVRKLQRELANRRMMSDVKKADVIITNPTHIAVALQYSKEMIAPKLIAKGAGDVAERIKKEARENNIPVVENKPLARTIFKTMKLGQIIPRELYTAVAEVLSYIFRLKKRRTV